MADTVITTPGNTTSDGSGAVWAVAIVVIVAILLGAFVWYQRNDGAATTNSATPAADINVTIPGTGGSDVGGSGATN